MLEIFDHLKGNKLQWQLVMALLTYVNYLQSMMNVLERHWPKSPHPPTHPKQSITWSFLWLSKGWIVLGGLDWSAFLSGSNDCGMVLNVRYIYLKYVWIWLHPIISSLQIKSSATILLQSKSKSESSMRKHRAQHQENCITQPLIFFLLTSVATYFPQELHHFIYYYYYYFF